MIDEKETIDVQEIQAFGYESSEVKRRKEFKYYNNSLIYVSFRN